MQKIHRAVIAGTGRAGTSFLVDFLKGVGVPTEGLNDEVEHKRARAGLERPLTDSGGSYLVKDPSLFEYLDEVDFERITIDALIIPVRDLTAVAMSRMRLEYAAVRERDPQKSNWSTMGGQTPGGCIFSLNVTDQERVLAVGQARLLEWALTHDLPLFLLQYPRLVSEGEYVVDTLWPWLQQFTDRELALSLFSERSAARRWESDGSLTSTLVPRDEFLAVTARKESVELLIAECTAELKVQRQKNAELEQLVGEGLSTIRHLERLIEEGEIKRPAKYAEIEAQLDHSRDKLAEFKAEIDRTLAGLEGARVYFDELQ